MCGRYYIEIDEIEWQEIVSEIEERMKDEYEQMYLKLLKTRGEIFPSDIVPVRAGPGGYEPMKWGFILPGGKGKGRAVINARSETALEKPMFRQSMTERRCLIPASGYYEWQKSGSKKTKYQLYLPDNPIYFAGCYRQERNSPLHHFVILTRQAVDSIGFIHDRMPVIIPPNGVDAWLNGSLGAMEDATTELSYEQVF